MLNKLEPLDKNSIYIQINSSEQHSIVMDIFASKGWKREDGHDPRYCRFIPGTSVIYADEFFYWSHCAAGVFGTVITFDQFMETISERDLKLIEIAKHMSSKGHHVRIGDVLKYIDTHHCFIDVEEGHRSRDMEALDSMLRAVFYSFVGKQDRPIDEQDESCVEYIFSLIK